MHKEQVSLGNNTLLWNSKTQTCYRVIHTKVVRQSFCPGSVFVFAPPCLCQPQFWPSRNVFSNILQVEKKKLCNSQLNIWRHCCVMWPFGLWDPSIPCLFLNQNRQYFTLPGLFHVESMEGGMDCRNSRWIPWNGGWIPYFWWMDSMEWWMDSMVFPHGFHTFSSWIPYLFHMESSWNKFLESSIHTHALKFKLEWGLIDWNIIRIN